MSVNGRLPVGIDSGPCRISLSRLLPALLSKWPIGASPPKQSDQNVSDYKFEKMEFFNHFLFNWIENSILLTLDTNGSIAWVENSLPASSGLQLLSRS
jgi:hypothetical protein